MSSNQVICAICLDHVQCACETSCGHVFCAGCISDYWLSLARKAPKICPLDRKVVVFVIPKQDCINCENVNNQLKEWNFILQGQYSTLSHASEMWYRIVILEHKIWIAVLVWILLVLYLLSPIDLIPDSVPIFGYLDDIVIIFVVIVFLVPLLKFHAQIGR